MRKINKQRTGEWIAVVLVGSNLNKCWCTTIAVIYYDNQPVTYPMVGTNNKNLFVNCVLLGLWSHQVCDNVLPLIALMVVNMLEVGGDYSSQDTQNILNVWPFTGLH